jgi:hypothetical protein
MKDVFKNYKKYIQVSRKQTQYLKNNFSMDNMTSLLEKHLQKVNVVNNIPLTLPKLTKLPKLNKING